MKIEGNRPSVDTTPADKVAAARTAGLKTSKASSSSGIDQFSVSADAKLASAAIEAAANTSDIRLDLVERAKALLADNKVGNDPQRLADAIIDGLLKNG
jgi:anti-sigma28 factor (negative regulator of flagellin synthesis)